MTPQQIKQFLSDYEACCIILHQAVERLDEQGIDIDLLDGNQFCVRKGGLYLNVEEGWVPFPLATMFPDRPTATLAALATTKETG